MSIFKDTFPEEIKTQIEKRQDRLVRRSPKDLSYLNSRKAWVRMSSGVDIIGKVTEETIELSNTLAKSYVLQGGTLYDTTLSDSGSYNGVFRQGIGGDSNKAYSTKTPSGKTHKLGIRPMPGITNVDIKSKSAYGSLREATVNFICWDITQLEDLELLYMRPGFTVLLEWGWSPYINNDDTYVTTTTYYDDFLKEGKIPTGDNVLQDIYKYLHVTKSLQESNGNYDAMIGYVKNFQWSFRADGGYDCQTTIISFGEVLESLKINYSVANISYTDKTNGFLGVGLSPENTITNLQSTVGSTGLEAIKSWFDNFPKVYDKNKLSGILYEVSTYLALQLVSKSFVEGEDPGIDFRNTSIGGNSYNLFAYNAKFTPQNQSTSDLTKVINLPNINNYQYYITLESLCDLLNRYILISSERGSISSVSTKDKNNAPLLCLTHPLQISVDPSVCLINPPVWRNGFSFPKRDVNLNENTPGLLDRNRNSGQGDPKLIGEAKALIQRIISFAFNDYPLIVNRILPIETNIPPYKGDETDVKIYNAIQQYFLGASNKKKAIEELVMQYEIIRQNPGISKNPAIINLEGVSLNDFFKNAFPEEYIAIKPYGQNGFLNWNQILNQLAAGDSNLEAGSRVRTEIERILNEREFTDVAKKAEDIRVINEESEKISESSKTNLKFLNKLLPFFKDDNIYNGLGYISNIYVNINYLYQLSLNQNLESLDKKEKNEINLYDYLKTIVGSVQSSIGNVNNFDIHVDPIDSIGRIIDINFTSENPEGDYKKAVEIEIQGTRTTATNVTLQSQIFPEQSSIVAISAQNGGGTLGLDNNTLVGFNQGIKDRILPEKYAPRTGIISPPPSDISAQLSNLKSSISSLFTYISDFQSLYSNNIRITDKPSVFNLSNATEYKNALRDIINFIKASFNDPNQFKSIIPTKLSLTMDGIGGIVIGNIFRIPEDRLPRGYKGDGVGRKLGYIVTGLGHKIDTKFWETTIDAQTVILETNQNKEQFDYNNIIIQDPNNPGGFKLQTPPPTSTVGANDYGNSPVALFYKGKNIPNGFIPSTELRYLNTDDTTSNKIHRLHPKAAAQWEALVSAARANGFTKDKFNISYLEGAAYRDYSRQQATFKEKEKEKKENVAASAGSSPHGWGGAVDIQQLFTAAGGNGDLSINKIVRETNDLYKWLAQNGPTYGWYNPYRLADNAGTADECWHFEYWGPAQ